ncbi:putative RDD family membrane protein YckC [Lactobacillus colini]|uniref:RDD family membrane protein YckC n=1 Tax=Lactobacillus colini TaxID=1819254 RepID=A0ABS4MFS6_9LACO|nr:RDD family protein [Lactobacillus colini]MBP2058219.1 putative RDD family membrane protein YckC [Lactobacillus colini]
MSGYKKDENVKTEYSSKRIVAAVIDWFTAGIICSLPLVLAFAFFNKKAVALVSFYQIESSGIGKAAVIVLLMISLVLTFVYYVIIPYRVFPGQTLGKHIMNLKIVHLNGSSLNLKYYFIRNFLILNLIEGAATFTSNYFRVLTSTISRNYIDNYVAFFWNILTLLSIVLVFMTSKHLSIHDYISKSTVVSL